MFLSHITVSLSLSLPLFLLLIKNIKNKLNFLERKSFNYLSTSLLAKALIFFPGINHTSEESLE